MNTLSMLTCICFAAVQPAHGQMVPAQAGADTAAVLTESNPPAAGSSSSTMQTAQESDSLAGAFVYPAADPMLDGAPAASGQVVREVTQEKPVEPMRQELIIEGLYSYGNYKIFASGFDMKLFDAGIEYDRHTWGYFLKAQMDYVAEFLPFVLLDKPLKTDIFGNPQPGRTGKYNRQLVPGIGFSPIGFRLLWRSKKTIKPYLEAKGGVLLFDKKVPSSEATYESFSLQSATGVQVKLNEKWGVRLGLFSDFHFSDAFIVPVNPGLDVMNANLGVSYHF
jgi:hypothetical protein